MRAGGSWTAQLAQEIAEASAFILLIGEAGVGKWQVPEYDEALDRWVKSEPPYPLVVVLIEGQTAPGLPFLRQLHWIVTPDPASEKDIARIFDAASGVGARPSELWRYASPYRGLEAMEEKNSDYFFGRTRETIEALDALAAKGPLPVLIGNSGVGKSSLAQAGVLAALKRQAWPDKARASGAWPAAFQAVLPHSAPEIARQSLPTKFRFPAHEMERPKRGLSAFRGRQGGFRGAGKEWDGSAEFGSNLSRRLQSDGAPLLGPEHR